MGKLRSVTHGGDSKTLNSDARYFQKEPPTALDPVKSPPPRLARAIVQLTR
jgi:hypothetical protein